MPTIYRNNIAYSQTVAYGGFTPVGTIISVMGNSAPANYLECDGNIYNISDYPDLANYFIAQFGVANKFGGDGTTTFGVPDLRGEFLRGTGTNSHSNQGDGDNVGAHQDATLHNFNWSYNGEINSAYKANISLQPTNLDSTNTTTDGVQTRAKEVVKSSSGGPSDGQYTSRPTNTSVLFCIAVKNIYIENGEGSGSSKHTIQDTDGTAMADEDNLQFIGLDVQDDPTNDATTVESFGLNSDSLDDVTSGGVSNTLVANSNVYSTNEQVVGKWIDGKPIYQKTLVYASIPKKSTYTLLTDIDTITNFSQVHYRSGILEYVNSFYVNSSDYFHIIPCVANGDFYIYYDCDTTHTVTDWKINIQYTKTTD